MGSQNFIFIIIVVSIGSIITAAAFKADKMSKGDAIPSCPPTEDRREMFQCPSPDRKGRYKCLDDVVLCDGIKDCPEGEDEDRQQCMFYKSTEAHLDEIADAIVRYIRGRKQRSFQFIIEK